MKILFLIAFLFLPQISAAIGIDQGNGGNSIYCPGYFKTFSLDYILAKEVFDKKITVVKKENTQAYLKRISTLIDQKIPELSFSFSEFLKYMDNYTDSTKPYIWQKNPHGLDELDDQNYQSFPLPCKTNNNAAVQVYQVVIRNEYSHLPGGTHVVFDFDNNHLLKLDPLQRSFIYVHEWLWGVSDNVVKNRQVNYLLHSILFDQLSSSEIKNELNKIQFKIKDPQNVF